MNKNLTGIGLLVAALIFAGLWLAAHPGERQPGSAFDLASNTGAALPGIGAPARVPPVGWEEYRSSMYGFSVFYPHELTVQSHDGGGGAATITFQNVQTAQGFQMFIVPYPGEQVTQQRFLADEPSGVRNNPVSGLLDGANAVAFYSTDARLGDTYEVWFIHGGYLYEVTTLKPLDTWLQSIMQTWQFI